jgi:hypothetical protein
VATEHMLLHAEQQAAHANVTWVLCSRRQRDPDVLLLDDGLPVHCAIR